MNKASFISAIKNAHTQKRCFVRIKSPQVIAIGFLAIITVLALIAIMTLRENSKLADINNKIYQHPFTVSNTVLKINNDILAMHRYMKDVVLATTDEELELAASLVKEHEDNVYQHFELVKARFLGDMESVNVAFKSFEDWQLIRSEVIRLKRELKHRQAANITIGKGATHVKLLTKNMDALIDFAQSKALEFKSNSQRAYTQSKRYLHTLFFLATLSALLVAFSVIKLVRRAEKSINESEERFKALFNNSQVSVWSEDFSTVYIELNNLRNQGIKDIKEYLNENTEYAWELASKIKVNHVNEATLKLFKAKNETEFLGRIDETFGDKAINVFIDEVDAIWSQQEAFSSEANFITLDGQQLHGLISFQIPTSPQGFKNVPVSIVDISERKKNENKLKLLASVFTHARESITITDADAQIIDINDTFTTITGYCREEVIGENPRILHSGLQPAEFYIEMWGTLLADGYWSGELWNRRKNGEIYAEMKTISAVYDSEGNTTHYVALGSDITQQKNHQSQLEQIAHYDVLTNLPNRSLLADRLSQEMLHAKRNGQSLAVVFIDLDGFKQVNDTHGHKVGDELLIALSIRMKDVLREVDTLSRIGGDEFVAVLANLKCLEDSQPVLDRLLNAASEPFTIGEIVVNVSASIGITFYPQDDIDADQLMRHADQAMYQAKELGKNRYQIFDTAHDDAIKHQKRSLNDIREALDTGQFVLYYQPKVNMRSGIVTGIEALIRWHHPDRGLLPPSDFLPLIENHPMMIELGEWVINNALKQISEWQCAGVTLPSSLSVNIAALQLQHPDFSQRLSILLSAHPDISPNQLELEVLETSALNDWQAAIKNMEECISQGVSFALDDFGTGYASLTYLRRLPVHIIKIDQSFVRDMITDKEDLAIVKGAIALANSFNREVIAEGVETIDHGLALLELGCELAQGYGIAKPMKASNYPEWQKQWEPDAAWLRNKQRAS